MPAKVILKVTDGPIRGAVHTFEEHDTFIFGRDEGCHARLPEGDKTASRHHFLLEVNPPAVRVRDLGSLNGTHVNGVKCGGRAKGEGPEALSKRPFPEVDLEHGDSIRVGKTVFTVEIEAFDSGTDQLATIDAPPQAGRTPPGGIEDYEIEKLLGRGGFGAVYLARRRADGLHVAVKTMIPRAAGNERFRRGFLREIESTTRIRHEHIVEVLAQGEAGLGFYFILEYCPGGNLAELMKQNGGKLSLPQAAPLMIQALQGLSAAHQHGFVHRDLKPANLLLTGEGGRTLKIADFGLAKEFEKAGLSGMTRTGTAAGTPYFMAREQLINFKYVRPVTDVWGMAATFYHLLTGCFVYDFAPGDDALAVVLSGQPVPLGDRDPTLPRRFIDVVQRALALDVNERYPSGAEFLQALQAVL